MRHHRERIFLTGLVINWIGDDAFDRRAVGALPLNRFLPPELEVAREVVEDVRHLLRARLAGSHRVDLAAARRPAQGEDENIGARLQLGAGDRCDVVLAVGQLLRLSTRGRDDEELLVHAEVHEEIDRLTVFRPHRVVDVVRFVLADQRARRSAGGRRDEEAAVVVGIELRVGLRDEEHLRIVGRDRRVVFLDGVLRQLHRARSVRVRDPHLALVTRSEQRRRLPRVHDLLSVIRQLVVGDREIAAGDSRLRVRLDRHRPQVRLLVVLVVRIHVVFHALARLVVGRFRIGRFEDERGAVRRPADVGHGALVLRELARFAAVDRQQVDLRELVVTSLGDERDGFAVGGPARSVLAVGAARQLRRIASVEARAPDVRDAFAGFPVGVGPGVDDLGAVRRQPRVGQTRNAQQIDDAHRPRRLRLDGCGGSREQEDGHERKAPMN